MPTKPKRKPSGNPTDKPRRDPIPQPHGGALVPGAGGGPQPGSGRPPKAFKDFLAELRKDPEAQDKLAAVAKDSTNKNCVAAWKLIAEYDDEKPAKKLELSAPLSTAERRAALERILGNRMGS